MKKISVTFALVLSLVLLLSVSALAAGSEKVSSMPTDKTIEVRASYQDSETKPDTVYSLDITWGSMNFIYQEKTNPVWNPDTHKYTYDPSGWFCPDNGNKISITSHSNAEVQCNVTFEPKQVGITGTISLWGDSASSSSSYYAFPTAVDRPKDDKELQKDLQVNLKGSLKPGESDMFVGIVTLSFVNPNE